MPGLCLFPAPVEVLTSVFPEMLIWPVISVLLLILHRKGRKDVRNGKRKGKRNGKKGIRWEVIRNICAEVQIQLTDVASFRVIP
jgi:hypothetical protein